MSIRAAVLFLSCLLGASAAVAQTIVLQDRRGDDHGNGDLIYPNHDDLRPGDLDLVSVTAEPVKDGTL